MPFLFSQNWLKHLQSTILLLIFVFWSFLVVPILGTVFFFTKVDQILFAMLPKSVAQPSWGYYFFQLSFGVENPDFKEHNAPRLQKKVHNALFSGIPPPYKINQKIRFTLQSKFKIKLNLMIVKQIKLNFSICKQHSS